jgi:ceramide glucosyltransferase
MPKAEPLLVPFREMLNFVLWVRSFLGRRVSWAGRVMVTGAGLKMRMDG